MKSLIIYHKDCNDGLMAAAVVAKYLLQYYPESELIFHEGVYGEAPPDIDGFRYVFIVDFSYPEKTMLQMITDCMSAYIKFQCYDHHKTAENDLQNIESRFVAFDESFSGCQLTWNRLFNSARPHPVDLVGDRDLWKFELEDSKAFHAGLQTVKNDPLEYMALLDPIRSDELTHQLVKIGREIMLMQSLVIERMINDWRNDFVMIQGYEFPVINCSDYSIASELTNELAKHTGKGYAAYYSDKDGYRTYGLRSIGEFDVSDIAKKMGGGGHKNASGFRIPFELYDLSHIKK